jgi:hypothetical protein
MRRRSADEGCGNESASANASRSAVVDVEDCGYGCDCDCDCVSSIVDEWSIYRGLGCVSGCGSGNASANGCRGVGNGDGGAQASASASCCGRDACALVDRAHGCGCDCGWMRLSELPERLQQQSRMLEPPQRRAAPCLPIVGPASASASAILTAVPRVVQVLPRSCCLESGCLPCHRCATPTTAACGAEPEHREHTRRGGEGGGGEAHMRRRVIRMRSLALPSVPAGSVTRSGFGFLRCGSQLNEEEALDTRADKRDTCSGRVTPFIAHSGAVVRELALPSFDAVGRAAWEPDASLNALT